MKNRHFTNEGRIFVQFVCPRQFDLLASRPLQHPRQFFHAPAQFTRIDGCEPQDDGVGTAAPPGVAAQRRDFDLALGGLREPL